jgi:hypothetical protein
VTLPPRPSPFLPFVPPTLAITTLPPLDLQVTRDAQRNLSHPNFGASSKGVGRIFRRKGGLHAIIKTNHSRVIVHLARDWFFDEQKMMLREEQLATAYVSRLGLTQDAGASG